MGSTHAAVEYAVRGESLRLAGNYSQAIKFFTAAIKLKPEYSWAYAHRAAARAALGNFVGSYKDFSDARGYYVSNHQYSWFLGQKAELFRLWARATCMRGDNAPSETSLWCGDVDVQDAPDDTAGADYGIKAMECPAKRPADNAFVQMSYAIRLFSKAHARLKSNPWILAHRGATHTMRYWIGHSETRLEGGSGRDFTLGAADFEKAYEINAGYGWAYAFHAVLVGLGEPQQRDPLTPGQRAQRGVPRARPEGSLGHGNRGNNLDQAMELIGQACMNGLDRNMSIMRIMMELATYSAGDTSGHRERSLAHERAAEYAWQTLQVDNEEAFARYFVADNVNFMFDADKLNNASSLDDDDANHTILRARADLNGLRARIIAMEGGLDCLEGKFGDALEKLKALENNRDLEALSLVMRDPAWACVRDNNPQCVRGLPAHPEGLRDAHAQFLRLFNF
ncbi:hypothetical protein BE11_03445 [Sorangium cellulosum]|nr:hypothetical protein BE11_03445 [Sorangium cellulosum]